MAAHSSLLAWRIPWTEEPGRLQSMGVAKESDTAELMEHTRTHAFKKLPHGQRRQRVRDGKEGSRQRKQPRTLVRKPRS